MKLARDSEQELKVDTHDYSLSDIQRLQLPYELVPVIIAGVRQQRVNEHHARRSND